MFNPSLYLYLNRGWHMLLLHTAHVCWFYTQILGLSRVQPRHSEVSHLIQAVVTVRQAIDWNWLKRSVKSDALYHTAQSNGNANRGRAQVLAVPALIGKQQ